MVKEYVSSMEFINLEIAGLTVDVCGVSSCEVYEEIQRKKCTLNWGSSVYSKGKKTEN